MVKMVYVDEITFEETEQKFEDFHFYLANVINGSLLSKFKMENFLKPTMVSPIMSDKQGEKLIIGVTKQKRVGEESGDKYRITIEKIENGK